MLFHSLTFFPPSSFVLNFFVHVQIHFLHFKAIASHFCEVYLLEPLHDGRFAGLLQLPAQDVLVEDEVHAMKVEHLVMEKAARQARDIHPHTNAGTYQVQFADVLKIAVKNLDKQVDRLQVDQLVVRDIWRAAWGSIEADSAARSNTVPPMHMMQKSPAYFL